MKNVTETLKGLKQNMKPQHRSAFCSALVIGLLIHLPIMVSDIPNHDGLSSMYFDQNMITSGRFFLEIACGFSSFFTLPWVIGLLGLLFLGVTAVLLTELLEIETPLIAGLIAGLLVAFPSLTSTFAYVFTLDGYMLAMTLSVASVLLTKKYKKGWIPGAVCLAISLGTYQAYLAFACLLCLYEMICLAMEAGSGKPIAGVPKTPKKEYLLRMASYPLMGGLGAVLYVVLLKLLLLIQGKQLDTYQGIDGMSKGMSVSGILSTIPEMYRDFFSFSIRSKVPVPNGFAMAAFLLLALIFVWSVCRLIVTKAYYKSPLFYLLIVGLLAAIPLASNVVLLISPEVNYHLIMRYQWVLFPILFVAFSTRYGKAMDRTYASWGLAFAAFVLVFCYGICDNIGYSNLQKKYEKTYAYTLRLVDRIEQTPGYYQGIPVALIGVVGDESYPVTDLTGQVTGSLIGISGDYLIYKGADYESFIRNYLGVTMNFVDQEVMGELYYREEYVAMDSFPGENSVKIIDGILCVKTENATR